MTLATYLLYVAAVAVLIVTPGPTMLMCLANAVNHGPARALVSAAGALTASFAIMGLSALGLGALLAASQTAFTALKIVGAAYLIWLGVRTLRQGGASIATAQTEVGARRSLFAQGFLVGASNPKALLFFAAFFPQFIDPAAAAAPQFMLLAFTFVLGDFIMLAACAFGVGRVSRWLRRASVVRWINRVCGSLFAMMGAVLLLSRRST